MLPAEPGHSGTVNDPRAARMGMIAFLSNNITIACFWGSFSVLIGAVEGRYGIGRQLGTLGAPVLTLSTALCAPIIGILAARMSLRLLMLAGGVLNVLGFAAVALSPSYTLYLLAFALLLGPGMAAGIILPGTLVTRWYAVNRGRTLGLVNAPIIITIVPLGAIWLLQAHGLRFTYLCLAGLSAVTIVANLFTIDHPPGASMAVPGGAHGGPDAGAVSTAHLLRAPRFWAMIFTFIASATGSVILSAHMVPMVRSWGMSATAGASLLSIDFFAGIIGTLLFGWLADRLGGALALACLGLYAAALWLALLLHPAFVPMAVLAALIGTQGAGVVPVLSLALSEAFGRESFSRAFGLVQLIILPFSVLCVPAVALVVSRTGSYDPALLGMAVFLAAAGLLAFTARRRMVPAPA